MSLRDYQTEACAAFLAGVRSGEGRRAIVNLPTGTGKTVVGASIARTVGGRVIWLAHTDELVLQPRRAFEAVWPEAEVGVVKASTDEWGKPIILSSVQTLRRTTRLERVLGGGAPALVVVDEAHHACAGNTYHAILEALSALGDHGPPVLGLTATVERGDGRSLGSVWQKIAYRMSLADAVAKGHLVPPIAIRAVIDIDLSHVHTRAGDLALDELEDEMIRANAAAGAAAAYVEHARGRKAIVFTVSIDQAIRTAEEMRKLGVRAEHVSGLTPIEERRAILARLASGETEAVANAAVLLEGFDSPSVSAIVMARPTKSKPLYIQAVGRGLRLSPGKTDCLIVDLVGAHHVHGLVQADTLLGDEGGAGGEGGGGQARDEEEPGDAELDRVRAFLAAATGASGLRASAGRWRWIEAREGLLVLEIKTSPGSRGMVALNRDTASGGWVAVVVLPGGEPTDLTPFGPVTFEDARALAQAWCEMAGARPAGSAEAPWRRNPPSDLQVRAMSKWRVRAPEGLTAGDASDLLTARIARVRIGGRR